MKLKKDMVLEKIDPKMFQVNIDDLKSKSQQILNVSNMSFNQIDFQKNLNELQSVSRQITSEPRIIIDPKDFQRDREELENKIQQIYSESTEKMKKFRI